MSDDTSKSFLEETIAARQRFREILAVFNANIDWSAKWSLLQEDSLAARDLLCSVGLDYEVTFPDDEKDTAQEDVSAYAYAIAQGLNIVSAVLQSFVRDGLADESVLK